MRRMILFATMAAATLVVPAAAQRADQLTAATRQLVSVPEPVVALVNATVIDGTGAAPRRGQTVVISAYGALPPVVRIVVTPDAR